MAKKDIRRQQKVPDENVLICNVHTLSKEGGTAITAQYSRLKRKIKR